MTTSRVAAWLIVALGLAGTRAPCARPARAQVAPPERLAAGRFVYGMACATCHQAEGQGTRGLVPPLAGSERVRGDASRAIDVVLRGLSGKIVVGGETYDGTMPPAAFLTDQEVADVLTFVRASWGNAAGPVSPADVAAVRSGKRRPTPPAR